MAVDDDLLDPAEQAAVDQKVEVLAFHPGQQALQSRPGIYLWLSGPPGAPASGGTATGMS
jgi:hypothetical protein